jgi:glycerophosphoryl diester phosphodiesterase
MAPPHLIAHRGWALRYPENTRAALAAAIEAGARFLETDVQLARDGVPYLFHDRTLERLCGVPGAVHERTSAEVDVLRASEPKSFGTRFRAEPVARLAVVAELLRAYPGVSCFVELKRVALEHHGIDAVLDAVLPVIEPLAGRCALISFSLPVLTAARQRTRLPVGPVIEAWSELGLAELRALEAEYVFADLACLPQSGPLRVPHGRLAVYEVARPELALELGARGASFVETFAIGEMLAAFRQLGFRSEETRPA